jgi:hypothetical protein
LSPDIHWSDPVLHPLIQEITDLHRGVTRDASGRKVIMEGVAPHTVYGGWTRTEDGWDCDYDYEGLPDTVYPTADDCREAIADLAAARQRKAAA